MRQRDRYLLPGTGVYWHTPAPDVAVRIEGGKTTAVIVYATAGLRASELRALSAEALRGPSEPKDLAIVSDSPDPPSQDTLSTYWRALATEPGGVRHLVNQRAAELAMACERLADERYLLIRRDSQTPAEFYLNVGIFCSYALIEGVSPAKAISALTGVPATTAARWVREYKRRFTVDDIVEAM